MEQIGKKARDAKCTLEQAAAILDRERGLLSVDQYRKKLKQDDADTPSRKKKNANR